MSRSVPPRLWSDYKNFRAAVPFDAHISHRGRTQFYGSSLTIFDVSGVTTMTYDANGNQETIEEPSGDVTTNTWDGENRLIQVEHPSGDIITYAYNGDGLRVREDDGVQERLFFYDGNNLLRELDDVGATEAEFTCLPQQAYAEVISQRRDTDSSFYLWDGISNIRQLTDDLEVVTDEYSFAAFGTLRSSTGSTANSQQYKGRLIAYCKEPATVHARDDRFLL